MKQSKLITAYQAADILGVHHATIRRLINTGRLNASRHGQRLFLLEESEVKKFKESYIPWARVA